VILGSGGAFAQMADITDTNGCKIKLHAYQVQNIKNDISRGFGITLHRWDGDCKNGYASGVGVLVGFFTNGEFASVNRGTRINGAWINGSQVGSDYLHYGHPDGQLRRGSQVLKTDKIPAWAQASLAVPLSSESTRQSPAPQNQADDPKVFGRSARGG
jgi:hypothetical protein